MLQQFMAAMIQPGGGRNDIPQRLKRQFAIFNCTLPSNASIDKIFSVIALGHYCAQRRFGDSVCELVRRLVPSTRRLWQLTKIKMLPTPAKFHYVFNLRDLSRIWQGVINSEAGVINSDARLLQLWKHECTRVIADRFSSPDDQHWFDKTLRRIVVEDLGDACADMCAAETFFVDFMRDPEHEEVAEDKELDDDDDADAMPKIYEPVESLPVLADRLRHFMRHFNETVRGTCMDLVFFRDAIGHLVKISRIIRTPRGNALLVGVGGSGKQSLTKLASFIAGYKTFQINLTRAYSVNNLLDDLKLLYRIAGQQNKGVTFIFADQDVKDEGFLEYINNVLSSGVVAGLFARDELDEICNDLVVPMKIEYPRRPPTAENLYEYFLMRTRQNLHIVLCFSPMEERFRTRALKFPGLISGCTVDWFQRWPKEALIAVADHYLAKHDIRVADEDVTKRLVQGIGVLHDNVADTCREYFERYRRATHVTPKSYLAFLNGYKLIYTQKLGEIESMAERMHVGLDKLVDAGRSVAQLKIELDAMEKELEAANVRADKVLKEVAKKKEAAEGIKAQVQKVKDRAQHIVMDIETDKAKAEEKLEEAKPALLVRNCN